MRQSNSSKMLGVVMSVLLLLSSTDLLAQCNWSTKAVLPEYTNVSPGLAAFQPAGDPNQHLYVAWAGDDGYNTLNTIITDDGNSWYGKVTTQMNGLWWGLGMTGAQPGCGALFIAWMGGNNNMWGAISLDGYHWSGPDFLFYPTWSTPSLRGDNLSTPQVVGLAFSEATYSSPP